MDEAKVDEVRLEEAGDESRVITGIGRFLPEVGSDGNVGVEARFLPEVGLDGNAGVEVRQEPANLPPQLVEERDIASLTRSCVTPISS